MRKMPLDVIRIHYEDKTFYAFSEKGIEYLASALEEILNKIDELVEETNNQKEEK